LIADLNHHAQIDLFHILG